MTAPPPVLSSKTQVALWSMVSVLLLVVMCAIYVAHGDPQSVERGRPDSLAAVLYTAVLAAPYALIVVLSLLPNPPQLLFEFAKALSRASIVGILFVTIASGLGLLLLLMMTPSPLGYVGMVMGDIAGQLQGAGLSALLALFVVQFALRYCARRALAPDGARDARMAGGFGYATLLLPVFIFVHINSGLAATEQRDIQKSMVENETRAKAESVEVDKRTAIALEAARTSLHICVHTNCVDSLVTALKNQNVILEILPNKEGGFFAVATAGEYAPTKYMTDETGILLREIDDIPLRTVTPSSAMPALLVDSVFLDLAYIRGCISSETVSEWTEYPLHLPKDVGCRLHGDTSVVHLRDGTPYRLIYASPRSSQRKPVRTFSLSMRPVVYGKPYVRSFLMTEDSAYVTTANRPARKSDPAPWGCEVRPDDCSRRR
ncbi:MAG: hypothetical protein ACJ8AK_11050 [Gemmatimonadaceae bacterium]